MSPVTSTPEELSNVGYHYYAFISYSRKDENWAKWLQRAIEYYRLPSVIRKECQKQGKDLPKLIRPIFRDKTDLTAKGGLRQSLRQELKQSKYLIVICSPASAHPNANGNHWVNSEVLDFQNMGRKDHIIPLIVSGKPNSTDPAQECYPPALLDTDDIPLGISVNETALINPFLRSLAAFVGMETGRNDALLKIVSVLLGLNYDVLKQRHRRRARQQYFVAALTALLMFAGAGWFYDMKFREHKTYFADYIERRGVPEGIYPLSVEQMSKRNRHYRFIHKNGKLQRLIHANSAGIPMEHEAPMEERPTVAVFSGYTENKMPSEVEYFSENGRCVLYQKWSNDRMAVDFKTSKENDSASPSVLPPHMTSIQATFEKKKKNNSAISRYLFEYDHEGFIVRQSFKYDIWNKSIADANHVYGYIFERDSQGRVLKKRWMGSDGNPWVAFNGTSGMAFVYDEQGNRVQSFLIDKNGNPVRNSDGVVVAVEEFDENNNPVVWRNLASNGKLTNGQYNYAMEVRRFDVKGNIKEVVYNGMNGKPCAHKYGYAKITQRYDSRGKMTEEAYFGVDGKPCLNNATYAKRTQKRDNLGNLIEEAYFGIDGKPCLNIYKYAKYIKKYNSQSRLIEKAFFDVNGNPCQIECGHGVTQHAKHTLKYDKLGNITEVEYFDIFNNPCLHDGYSKFTQQYNNRGQVTQEATFGIDGKPCLYEGGYAQVIRKYNDFGKEIEIEFLGVDGNPSENLYGYAKLTKKYDDRGNITEVAFFGVDGKPCRHSQGHAKLTSVAFMK